MTTFYVTIRDEAGAMDSVLGLCRSRGFELTSMQLGPSLARERRVLTLDLLDGCATARRVETLLVRLDGVLEVVEAPCRPFLGREHALIVVAARQDSWSAIRATCRGANARIIDLGADAVVIEVAGPSERINDLIASLGPWTLQEIVRSAPITVSREGTRTARAVRAA